MKAGVFSYLSDTLEGLSPEGYLSSSTMFVFVFQFTKI